MIARRLLWFLWIIMPEAGWTQQPLFQHFQRYDAENGLPQSYVTGIAQDGDGFIWVSTLEGLARYDGKEFLRFYAIPGDSTTLTSSRMHGLASDRSSHLWVLHVDNTIDKFDTRSFRVTRNVSPIQHKVESGFTAAIHHRSALLADVKGNWLSYSDSLLRLFDTTANQAFGKFFFRAKSQAPVSIVRHCLGSDGKLWLITPRGLEVLSPGDALPTNVGMREEVAQIDLTRSPILLAMPDRIIIGGRGVLHTYRIRSGEWGRVILPEGEKKNDLPISLASLDSHGQLVFEYQGRILRLEKDDRVTVLWKMPTTFEVSVLLVDQTNTLWVGTNADGLYRVNLMTTPFQAYSLRKNFIADVLTDQFRIPHEQTDKFNFTIPGSYYLRYFYRDRKSVLLTLENYYDNPGILLLQEGSLTSLLPLSDMDSFTGGPEGTCIIMTATQELIFRSPGSGSPARVIRTSLPNSAKGSVIEMQWDGRSLWVITKNELFELRDGKVVASQDAFDGFVINTIRNDPKREGVLWVGTLGGGLYKVAKADLNVIKSYTKVAGLPNATINAIVPDSSGFLWISTNQGISRFDPDKEVFANFTTADGLSETEFNRHHHLLLPNGHIAFGGSRGYTVVQPDRFVEDTLSTDVLVTRLTSSTGDYSVSNPLEISERLEFDYSENTFGLEVAAMQFNSPEKNRFRYRLEGVDKNWVDNGSDQKIRFNQLPYGSYTLHLNASNTAGIWSQKIRSIPVIIHPPFWLTWWAYMAYGVIIFGGVMVFWNSYKERLKARQEAAFNLRESQRLREIDEMKTRFFSNITHEFRTPLTLILTPLEKYLTDRELSENVQQLLNSNYRHASQLLRLVNQLLDIGKLEAGRMPVHAVPGEILPFVHDCVNSFLSEAVRKSITLKVEAEAIEHLYLFDKDKLEEILSNLVGNAIKFTPEGGQVICNIRLIEVESKKEWLRLTVADTGVGIPESEHGRIFERFHQVDATGTRRFGGTGIGLALVKELVDLLGGTVQLTSQPGRGSTFVVDLPVERISVKAAELSTSQPLPKQHKSGEYVSSGDVPVLLVVEDNPELRSFLVENLATTWKVLEAEDGFQAWELMFGELPEVVISDVMMPGMSGFEFCKRAKEDFRTAHISFVMLTAKAAQESRIEGFEAGADEYISKPFHMYELELRIRNLLQNQENLRDHFQSLLLDKSGEVKPIASEDPFLTRILAYVDENMSDPLLSIEQMAEALSMSKSTLGRKCRVLLNQSPNDFVRQYRLHQAVRMLGGSMTVAEVAHQVGFESPSYFSQCFRDQFGVSPSSFQATS